MPLSLLQRLRPADAGMLLMALAMFLIPMMDASAKYLSQWLSAVQIVAARFALQSLFIAIILIGQRRLQSWPGHGGWLCASGVSIALAIVALVEGLHHMPLANAIAIFFIEPLLLMLLSAWLLKEHISRDRYLAVLAGLAGALIVIRPNWSTYGWVVLLPALAALGYAIHFISIRHLAGQVDGLSLQFWNGLIATLVALVLLGSGLFSDWSLISWQPMAWTQAGWLVLMGALSALTYMLINAAFKRTEAGVLAPFQYLEIIGATTLGYLVFGDLPDALTWLGTALILMSGLYVVRHGRQHSAASNKVKHSGVKHPDV